MSSYIVDGECISGMCRTIEVVNKYGIYISIICFVLLMLLIYFFFRYMPIKEEI